EGGGAEFELEGAEVDLRKKKVDLVAASSISCCGDGSGGVRAHRSIGDAGSRCSRERTSGSPAPVLGRRLWKVPMACRPRWWWG
ncbi:unnamed protein product, partial [Urochloa humidicola]